MRYTFITRISVLFVSSLNVQRHSLCNHKEATYNTKVTESWRGLLRCEGRYFVYLLVGTSLVICDFESETDHRGMHCQQCIQANLFRGDVTLYYALGECIIE